MAGKALNEPEEIEASAEDISVVQARKEQLRRQAEMLRLEKELQRARDNYTKLNKEAYSEGKSAKTFHTCHCNNKQYHISYCCVCVCVLQLPVEAV